MRQIVSLIALATLLAPSWGQAVTPTFLQSLGGGGSGPTQQALGERRQDYSQLEQDEQACQAEQGGGFNPTDLLGGDSSGVVNPDIDPAPLVPATIRTPEPGGPPSGILDEVDISFRHTTSKLAWFNPQSWLAPVAEAQTSILNRSLNSFGSLSSLRLALTQNGFSRDLTSFVGEIEAMGGNLGQVSASFQTVSDLTRIQNVSGLAEVFGQVQNLGGRFDVVLGGSNGLRNLLVQINGTGDLMGLANSFGQINNLGGNFSAILGGAGGFNRLIGSFGKIGDLNSLAGAFGQFKNLNATFGQLTGGFGGFNSLLGGLGNVRGLSSMPAMLGQLGNLGGGAGDILGGFGNFKNFFDSAGSINNLGDMTNVLGQASKLGAGLDDIVGGFDSFGQAFNSIGDLGNLSELPGTLAQVANAGGTFDTLMSQSGFGNMSELVNGFSAGGPNSILGPLAAGGNLLNDPTGLAASALAVPVVETGGLLNATQNISDTTGQIKTIEEQTQELTSQIKDLQIQICTHLKSIRRIQLNFEEKEFALDSDSRKASARALNDHKNQFIRETLNRGYEMPAAVIGASGDNKQPLYVTDSEQYVEDAITNASGGFLEQVESLSQDTNKYPHLAAAHENLAREETATYGEKLASDFTKQEFDDFVGDWNEGGWDAWLKIIQDKNNPRGVENIVRNDLDQAKSRARQIAEQERTEGQGYLPIRECVEKSSKGFCLKWRTLVPGSTIGEYTEALVTSPLRQAEQGDEAIEDFIIDELAVAGRQVKNLRLESDTGLETYDDAAGDSIFETEDPCPAPGPCPKSGWGKSSGQPVTPPELGELPANNIRRGIEGGLPGTLTGLPGIDQTFANNISDHLATNLPERITGVAPSEMENVLNIEITDILSDLDQFTNLPRRSNTDQMSQENLIKIIIDFLLDRATSPSESGTPTGSVPPTVIMSVQTPSLEQALINPIANISTIAWQTTRTNACTALNHWWGARKGNESLATGDAVSLIGEKPIRHPIQLPSITAVRVANKLTINLPAMAITDPKMLANGRQINPAITGSIGIDDQYRLVIADQNGPISIVVGGRGQINPPTATRVVDLFRQRIEALQTGTTALAQRLNAYEFYYQSSGDDGQLLIKPRLNYQLRCTARSGEEVIKEVNITR
ncbi:MAG: hypothetical protein AAB468_00825 [Patescibacteria group bacterium]